jgi:hypothetical protein
MQGRQQQTAIPIMQARATQKTTKNTSNARKTMQSLQSEDIDMFMIPNRKFEDSIKLGYYFKHICTSKVEVHHG